jgi:NAD kinase
MEAAKMQAHTQALKHLTMRPKKRGQNQEEDTMVAGGGNTNALEFARQTSAQEMFG